METLQAGAAECFITPPARGTFLIGPLAESTGVNDELCARVLVLSQGSTAVALVTLDILGLDFANNDILVRAVSRETGILPAAVMVNASHTHSAPLSIPWNIWERDSRWLLGLPDLVSAAAVAALRRLRPVTVRAGRIPVEIGLNRRSRENGMVVMRPNYDGCAWPFVDVVAFDTEPCCPCAVLMTCAAHPVIIHAASRLISADYPGYAVRAVRPLLPQDCIVLFAQGCAGNVNGHPLQGGVEAAARAGETLGRAALAALRAACPMATGPLRFGYEKLALPLQPPPGIAAVEPILAQERNALVELRRQASSEPTAHFAGRSLVRALEELAALARESARPTLPFRVQGFALGKTLAVLGLSHEVFAEYSWWIDAHSPFAHTLTLAYTNGCESYVGTADAYAEGGYETDAFPQFSSTLAYHHRLTPAPQVETGVRQAALNMLADLFAI